MYKRLTRSRIRAELASPVYFWLRIINSILRLKASKIRYDLGFASADNYM